MAMTERKLVVERYFTTEGVHPYDEIEWDIRDSVIQNAQTGKVSFEQKDVEVPKSWSFNATNIAAQKYFRGNLDSPDRERSVKQLIDRVVNRYHEEGLARGYFADEDEAQVFKDELTHLLVNQKAAFNSPVWFNVGWRGKGKEQVSACFILSVTDEMSSILNWYVEEGTIFKHGSGSGVNLSKIRSSKEKLKSGGTASGPVSFMRGADASAGTIKSGGATRRAAKMVVLNVSHPDIREFIWCKALEEKKALALREAGFDMDLDGKDTHSIQYQNANNSVRVDDEFMQAVLDDGDYDLKAVTTGETIETVKAKELFREIAEAAWQCADPGVQYDTVINDWHTCPNTDRINGSNPCSEYMHVDNSSCNLASLNLMKFVDEDDVFDLEGYKHAIAIMFLAQEISISFASFPTEKIGENTRAMRQLGQGFANLGALLMSQGLPYDSDEGRAWAAALMAIMTGHCYATSALIAERVGAYDEFEKNREAHLHVMRKHRQAVEEHVPGTDGAAGLLGNMVPLSLRQAARDVWDEAIELGEVHGYRNAQATVLAPTGTIGLLMDCDTTGIEPDLALKKTKKLVGGGTMKIVNHTVPRALQKLGYSEAQIAGIVDHIDKNSHVIGAPDLREEHMSVFDTAMGTRSIHYMGHVKMMAATQPFISGAISKTVNLPEDVTVEDVEQVYIEGWRLGIKALALYRDNCKVAQPLSVASDKAKKAHASQVAAGIEMVEEGLHRPVKRDMPDKRRGQTIKLRVLDTKGYATVNEFEDGTVGEVFLRVSKAGSTLNGIMDAFAVAISLGLQHGVPLEAFVAQYVGTDYEPRGMTRNADFPMAKSILDLLFKQVALEYLPVETRHAMNIKTAAERAADLDESAAYGRRAEDHVVSMPVLEASTPEEEPASEPVVIGENEPATAPPQAHHGSISLATSSLPFCGTCGIEMVPAGSCFTCTSCGSTSGCS